MNLHLDKSVVFEDTNTLNLARNNWPKKDDVYRYKDSDVLLKVETQPMYIKGVEPRVQQTNPKSWGVVCSARNMDGEILKGYVLSISSIQELPLEYIGNTKDLENTEE